MSGLTSKEVKGLMEAYHQVYAPQEISEEQVWEEVELWVNQLLDEGYDLSDYTWEEMYESYIQEQQKKPDEGDIGYRVGRGLAGALRDLPSALGGQLTGRDNPALQRQRERGDKLKSLVTTGQIPRNTPQAAKQSPQQNRPLVDKSGRNVFDGTPAPGSSGTRPAGSSAPSRPAAPSGGSSAPSRPSAPAAPSRPSAPSGGSSAPSASSAKPPAPAAAPAGQTGDKAKDMDTWAKANPKLAAAPAERARTRGTQQTDNPLMKDFKSRLPMNSPSVQSPDVAKLGKGNQSLTQNPNALKAAPAKEAPAPTKPAPTSSTSTANPFKNTAAASTAVRTATSTPAPTKPAPAQRKTQLFHTDLYDLVKGHLLDEDSKDTPYDVVLDYLFENGHVDTLEEAHYVMLEMDSETIQSIVEADSLAAQQERRRKRQAANMKKHGTPGFDYSKPPSGKRGYLDTLDDEAREKKKKERNDNEDDD
jgi:hypothetical protein